MIRVNELRIGSKLYYQGHVITVTMISPNTVYYEDRKQQSIKAVEPIPLTPAWLERCGFSAFIGDIIDDNRYYIQVGNNLYLNYYVRTGNWCIEPETWTNEQACWMQPKFLHQLQNLYFALTGEEINVSL